MALGEQLRKMPVPCGNPFRFVGNRIYNAYRKQCEFMLEDGAFSPSRAMGSPWPTSRRCSPPDPQGRAPTGISRN